MKFWIVKICDGGGRPTKKSGFNYAPALPLLDPLIPVGRLWTHRFGAVSRDPKGISPRSNPAPAWTPPSLRTGALVGYMVGVGMMSR
mmetsp:Transcript_37931/g.67833  ORF Transcript_37931/g.67833 Transcript_37931/m.67833 type:complete len:87 (-) Transcript_37931:832-1092(-)